MPLKKTIHHPPRTHHLVQPAACTKSIRSPPLKMAAYVSVLRRQVLLSDRFLNAGQPELICDAAHGLNHVGDVLVQVYMQFFSSLHHVVAIDARSKAFGFHLFAHRSDGKSW